MSEKMKGRVISEETRKKISESKKGKPWSEEKRQKIMQGRLNKKLIIAEA